MNIKNMKIKFWKKFKLKEINIIYTLKEFDNDKKYVSLSN
jgi:hypothetical protein